MLNSLSVPPVLKTKLDSLMATLNSVHPRDVFEYSFFGNSITIYQRDGGEIILGGYVSRRNTEIFLQKLHQLQDKANRHPFLFEAHTILQNALLKEQEPSLPRQF